MSTRAFLTIIDKDRNVIDAAFCPSSAYPSYLGKDALDALSKGNFADFLDTIREQYPDERDMLEELNRSWYVKGKDNKSDIFYDYAYEYDPARNRLNLYYYGDNILTVTPDNLPLCRYIFEKENALYSSLCFDEKSMTLKKDFWKEVRNMMKFGATEKDFQAVIDNNPSLLYMDEYRISDYSTRDKEKSFVKYVYDTAGFDKLKFFAGVYYGNEFTLAIQTPFYRCPLGTTSPLKTAAAAEKALAKILQERPNDIRGTMKLFKEIDSYKKAVNEVFEDESMSLDDRAGKSSDLKLDMLAKLEAAVNEFNPLGIRSDQLKNEIQDVVYSAYRRAKYAEEEKSKEKPSLDSMVNSAAGRTAAERADTPKELEMEPTLR